jgi:hypothetical protein
MTSVPEPDDRGRLLTFAMQWYRYGGGSGEDIFVEFGLTETAYFQRLLALVTHGVTGLPADVRAAIAATCESRLHTARSGGGQDVTAAG